MDLAYVQLDVPVNIGGKGARSEFNDDQYPGMRYDESTNSVVFGPAREDGVGWGHVVHWKRRCLQIVCPVCQKEFDSSQGLGGHRSKTPACREKSE